ncbi:hypothetical protein ABK040_010848 [Willaertia magna]
MSTPLRFFNNNSLNTPSPISKQPTTTSTENKVYNELIMNSEQLNFLNNKDLRLSDLLTPPRKDIISSTSSSANKSTTRAVTSPNLFDKLNAMKNSVASFNGGLVEDLNLRKEQEHSRVFELRDSVLKLERELTTEMKKRSEGDKSLQTIIENKVNSIEDTIEKRVEDKFLTMKLTIDALTKKVGDLERKLEESQPQFQRNNINALNVLEQLQHVKSLIEEERILRLEKEAQLLRKISDEISKFNQKFDFERSSRESFMSSVREEVIKEKIDKDLKKRLFNEIDLLKEELRIERETREQIDEQIVGSIDAIVKQVQESLRIVTK